MQYKIEGELAGKTTVCGMSDNILQAETLFDMALTIFTNVRAYVYDTIKESWLEIRFHSKCEFDDGHICHVKLYRKRDVERIEKQHGKIKKVIEDDTMFKKTFVVVKVENEVYSIDMSGCHIFDNFVDEVNKLCMWGDYEVLMAVFEKTQYIPVGHGEWKPA